MRAWTRCQTASRCCSEMSAACSAAWCRSSMTSCSSRTPMSSGSSSSGAKSPAESTIEGPVSAPLCSPRSPCRRAITRSSTAPCVSAPVWAAIRAASSRMRAIWRSSSISASPRFSGRPPWTISSMALASMSARSSSRIFLACLLLLLHAVPQLAERGEYRHSYIYFAGVQDLRDLTIRELSVELEGDDLLLPGWELSQETDQVMDALPVKEGVLRARRLVVQLVVPGRVLHRLGGGLLLAPVGRHLVAGDGEQPGAERLSRAQRLLLDERLLKDVRDDVQRSLLVLNASVDVGEDLGEVLIVELRELAERGALAGKGGRRTPRPGLRPEGSRGGVVRSSGECCFHPAFPSSLVACRAFLDRC